MPVLAACAGPASLKGATVMSMPASGQPAQVPAPTLAVGDEWRYTQRSNLNGVVQDTLILRVPAVDATGSTTEEIWRSIGRVQARYDRNLNPVSSHRLAYRPAFPRFQFPLSVGQSWSGTVVTETVPAQPGDSWTDQVQAKVAGWEPVTVAAGTFAAPWVDTAFTWGYARNCSAWGESRERIWYAPAVRNIVRLYRVDYAGGRYEEGNYLLGLDSSRVGPAG
jgi:hypothetical protein